MDSELKLGAGLKELQQKDGLSLRQLAASANINYSSLSKIENGVLPLPSVRPIQRLAQTLAVDEDKLLRLGGKYHPISRKSCRTHQSIQRLRAEKAEKEARNEPKGSFSS